MIISLWSLQSHWLVWLNNFSVFFYLQLTFSSLCSLCIPCCLLSGIYIVFMVNLGDLINLWWVQQLDVIILHITDVSYKYCSYFLDNLLLFFFLYVLLLLFFLLFLAFLNVTLSLSSKVYIKKVNHLSFQIDVFSMHFIFFI